MRLEIKGKKIGEKKTNFFLSVERPLNINISAVILYAHWISGNDMKKGGESCENTKKT